MSSRFSAVLRATTLAFATYGLVAAAAQAESLEDCVNIDSNSLVLCGTAADFAPQAAFLREALDSITGPDALRRSGKDGAGREWFGLVVAGAHRTTGNFTGSSANLVFGADTPVSATTSVGAMAYLERGEITAPSSPTIEREGVLVGPYFASQLPNNAVLNGHLVYGQPDYTINNVTTTGETVMATLTYRRTILRPGIDFGPFVSLSAKHEEPGNGDEIDARILTIGTSLDGEVVQTDAGFRQLFGRLELDIGRYEDSFGSSVEYAAPRLAIGSRFAFDNGGALQLLANASAASDQTTIFAVQASYRFDF